MANRNFDLSIIINALDKSQAAFKSLQENSKLTNTQLLAISATSTAVFGAIVYGAKKAADAAAEQQTAELKLAQAMINSKTYTDESFKSNLNYASSLQKISIYGDETIMIAQAMISMFVKDNELSQKLTKATIDLATAKGMDLVSAADLVAKSVGSSTNALARYGVTIEGAESSTQRANMAIDGISKLFSGQATAATMSYSGQMTQLKNQISDVQETLGAYLIPKLQSMITWVQVSVDNIQKFVTENESLIKALTGVGLTFVGIVAGLSSIALILPKVISGFSQLLTIINANPYIALATILLTLILNWNRMRDALDETSKAGKVFGVIMDTMKAGFFVLIDLLRSISQGIGALGFALIGNFKEAKKWFNDMNSSVANIPKNVKSAYDNIDVTTKKSTDTRTEYEKQFQKQLELLQKNSMNKQISNIDYVTDAEKKAAEEKLKIESDKRKMLDNSYAYQLKLAEDNKQKDLDAYAISLQNNQAYLQEKLIYLQQHKDDSLALNTEYYSMLDLMRQNDKNLEIMSQYEIKSGFMLMLQEMQAEQTNWYTIANTLRQGFTNAFTAGFTYMFQNIGKGWDVLGNTAKKILNGIADVFFQMSAQLIAQWIMQHTIMASVSTAFKTLDVANSAAIGAARAAAASAWTLWGAIGIGLAIGAAIMALSNAFASGTRGFGGGMALVGENGAELVNLPNGSDVLNNAETRNILNSSNGKSMGNSGMNLNINFSGSTFMGSVDEITEMLTGKIYKQLKLNAVL